MKLYMSTTSPYARIVRAVLIEKGHEDAVEYTIVNPWESPDDLVAANPYSQVPTLELDDGQVLTESLVIALYLEKSFPEPALIPDTSRTETLKRIGLGQGLLNAGVTILSTRRFHVNDDSTPLMQRRHLSLERAIQRAAHAVNGGGDMTDLGDLVIAIALEFLDFRMPDLDWRQAAPGLAAWHERLRERPSLASTRPE